MSRYRVNTQCRGGYDPLDESRRGTLHQTRMPSAPGQPLNPLITCTSCAELAEFLWEHLANVWDGTAAHVCDTHTLRVEPAPPAPRRSPEPFLANDRIDRGELARLERDDPYWHVRRAA